MFGDSNSLCVNLTARHEVGAGNLVDASCKTNSNCLYGLCTLGVCEAPPLTCPSSVAGTARQSSVTTLTPLMWLFSSTHLPIPSSPIPKAPSVLGMVFVPTEIPLGTLSKPARCSTTSALLPVSVAVTSEAMTAL
jgi:hypothetical protein